ncbi:MAG TPA: hypothetical protein VHY58_22715 [Streptosporangiaceae bacterium]|nr:hypothetical protein [Streptosporangiaceae bacterium]
MLPVVMLVAAAAVLIAVIVVAMGRGGELAFFQADYAPLKLDEVSATDVALFRPPTALWGYSMQATDEALNRVAAAITERDIEISALQQQVADLESSASRRSGYGPPPEPASRRDVRAGQVQDVPPGYRPDERRGAFAGDERPSAFSAERSGALTDERDVQPPPAASVWEPRQRANRGSGDTESTGQWAALPKRAPNPLAAGDEEEDDR